RLFTATGEPTVFWIEGACRHPFAESWEPTEDGARVAILPDIDPLIIEGVTCYWYPSDEPLDATIEHDVNGNSWLIVRGDFTDQKAALYVVYSIRGFSEPVALRVEQAEFIN